MNFMWAAAMLFLATPLAQAALGEAIENGSFRRGADSWTAGGDLTISREGGPNGVPAASIKAVKGAEPWAVTLSTDLTEEVPAGAPVTLSFWGKSSPGVKVGMMIEENVQPWEKLLIREFTLDSEWKLQRFSVAAPQALRPGRHRLVFHLGYGDALVHLAQISVSAPLPPKAPRPTPEKPVSLIKNGDFSQGASAAWSQGDGQALQTEVVKDPQRGHVLRVRAVSGPNIRNPWDLQIGQKVEPAVRAGDMLSFSAWMRSPESQRAWIVFELGEAPHTKVLMRMVELTPQWQKVETFVRSSATFSAGGSQFKLFFGGQNGTIEAAQMSFTNFGPDAPASMFRSTLMDYDRNKETAWRKEAEQRIEKLRKGTASLKLVDAQGKPLPSLSFTARQTRHHFRFGTAVTARWINSQDENGRRYRQHLESLFNTVVFENDMKWPPMESGSWGSVVQAMDWLQQRRFLIRGHTMVWGSYGNLPSRMATLGVEESKAAIASRIQDAAAKTQGRVYVWDVVNEAVTERELWDKLGWSHFVDAFRQARRAMPGVKLAYNDFNISNDAGGIGRHRREAIARAKMILDAGPYLDFFGDQAHQGTPATPISQVLKAWDEVHGALKIPIEITELDFVSWDEKSHGDYTEDYVTAAFSHPAVEAIVFWGFWEGAHWLGTQGGAMVGRDWKPRRSWTLLTDLINRKWKTNTQGKSAAGGAATMRGFFGEYEIQAIRGGKTLRGVLELKPGQKGPVTVTLK